MTVMTHNIGVLLLSTDRGSFLFLIAGQRNINIVLYIVHRINDDDKINTCHHAQ